MFICMTIFILYIYFSHLIYMSIPLSIIDGQFSTNVFQRRDIKLEKGISSTNFKKQYMDKKCS